MATITSVTARGVTRYKARVRKVVNGATVQHTKTLPTRSDAEKWARRLESELDRQDAGLVSEASKHTLGAAIGEFEKGKLPHLAAQTQAKYRLHLKHWKAALGRARLSELTPRRIAEAVRELQASGLSDCNAGRYVATLGSVYQYAVKTLHWLDASPMPAVAKPPTSTPRRRFLSRDEAARLLTACKASAHPDLYPAVLLSLTTGARRGEVSALDWKHLDLERAVALLPTSKNKDPRVLPLVPELVAILRPRKRDAGPVLARDLRRHWVKARAEAGLGDVHYHDLRHSAASFLAARGASLHQIGTVLGHRAVGTTARYAHLTRQHTEALVQEMAADVLGGGK